MSEGIAFVYGFAFGVLVLAVALGLAIEKAVAWRIGRLEIILYAMPRGLFARRGDARLPPAAVVGPIGIVWHRGRQS